MLHKENGEAELLKVRSMVGLIPLFAVEVLTQIIRSIADFKRRVNGLFLTDRIWHLSVKLVQSRKRREQVVIYSAWG